MMCHYCLEEMPPDGVTKDHVVPTSRGGARSARNIVRACRACNEGKSDRLPTVAHLDGCDRCRAAMELHGPSVKMVPYWDGKKARSGRRRRRPAPKPVADPAPGVVVPPDLACLSPAMRAFLLRRAGTEE